MKRIKGFTLIEIMIAVALISVISIPIFGNYLKTQGRARDAVRKSNITEISNALEQYYAVCGLQYPSSYAFLSSTTGITCLSPSIAIMPAVPKDPKSGNYYCQGATCTTTGYQICATLEGETAPTPTGFCLSNRQ